MHTTSNMKIANNSIQFNRKMTEHPLRTHIKITKYTQNKDSLNLLNQHYKLVGVQIINGTKYFEFHKRFRHDNNKNINSRLFKYVHGTNYLNQVKRLYEFEEKAPINRNGQVKGPSFSSYLKKRNKGKKRSRKISFFDKMNYGKSKRQFHRDRKKYFKVKLPKYKKRMKKYNQKVKKFKSNHQHYTDIQLKTFIKNNHPKKPHTYYGKRPIFSATLTVGNHNERAKRHQKIENYYRRKGKSQNFITHKEIKADNYALIHAIHQVSEQLGPNCILLGYATNPDEINTIHKDGVLDQNAGADHVHANFAFKETTKSGKPTNNKNYYFRDMTGEKNNRHALSKFREKIDTTFLNGFVSSMHQSFPQIKIFNKATLQRTHKGNGFNVNMNIYKQLQQQRDKLSQKSQKIQQQLNRKNAKKYRKHRRDFNYKHTLQFKSKTSSAESQVATIGAKINEYDKINLHKSYSHNVNSLYSNYNQHLQSAQYSLSNSASASADFVLKPQLSSLSIASSSVNSVASSNTSVSFNNSLQSFAISNFYALRNSVANSYLNDFNRYQDKESQATNQLKSDKSQHSNLSHLNNDLYNKIDYRREQNKRLTDEFSANRTKYNQLGQKSNQLNQDIKVQQSQKSKYSKNIANQENSINSLNTTIHRKRHNSKQLGETIKVKQNKYSKNIANQKDTINSLNTIINSKRQNSKQLDQTIKVKQNRTKLLNSKIQHATRQLKSIVSRIGHIVNQKVHDAVSAYKLSVSQYDQRVRDTHLQQEHSNKSRSTNEQGMISSIKKIVKPIKNIYTNYKTISKQHKVRNQQIKQAEQPYDQKHYSATDILDRAKAKLKKQPCIENNDAVQSAERLVEAHPTGRQVSKSVKIDKGQNLADYSLSISASQPENYLSFSQSFAQQEKARDKSYQNSVNHRKSLIAKQSKSMRIESNKSRVQELASFRSQFAKESSSPTPNFASSSSTSLTSIQVVKSMRDQGFQR